MRVWTVTHHAVVEWVLYEHRSLPRWYVICAFPGLAFVLRDMYIPKDSIMVYHTLQDKVNCCWVNPEVDMNASQLYRRKRTTKLAHC